MSTLTLPHLKQVAVDRPITTLCVVAIGPTLLLQTALLLAGVDLFPGKLAELVLLTGVATFDHLLDRRTQRRTTALRRPDEVADRGRTLGNGVAGHADPHRRRGRRDRDPALPRARLGWRGSELSGPVRADRSYREPVGGDHLVGFRPAPPHGPARPARRLDAHRDPVRADPPAARRSRRDGWTGTTWSEAFVNWAFLLGALPFLRYVIGVLLVDTRGSVLAAAMLHASFNASGALSVVPDGWQYVPALIVLTVLVTVHRRLSGRSLTLADVDPVPATELLPQTGLSSRREHTR